MEHLSNIELFYSQEIFDNIIQLKEDELFHCVNVFRKKNRDVIFVTDGKGKIFKSRIIEIRKDFLRSDVLEVFSFDNKTENLCICVPLLKNKDRFRFAIEKSVELGITRFIFFQSERTIAKNLDLGKIKKIMIESMKQSLRSYLPETEYFYSFKEMVNQIRDNNNLFLFDLECLNKFSKDLVNFEYKNYFIFGPEGGLDKNEISILGDERVFNLSSARLRTETAIVKLVALIT